MTGFLVLLALVAGVLLWAVLLYNGLVRMRNMVEEAWSGIDVQLKRRTDLIPNLVATVKGYAAHEKGTLEEVIRLRGLAQNAHGVGETAQAQGLLGAALGKLFALAENYPDLKANDSFQHLQQRISGLENAIADRRELYNEAVNLNNVRIEQFPDVIIARMFNFPAAELLVFSDAEKADVDMKSLFN